MRNCVGFWELPSTMRMDVPDKPDCIMARDTCQILCSPERTVKTRFLKNYTGVHLSNVKSGQQRFPQTDSAVAPAQDARLKSQIPNLQSQI
jgi:hypothetical protein